MLIITSDMHLADQTLAPQIAHRALDMFIDFVRNKSRQGRSPVQILFLGDIFDVLRSSRWLVEDYKVHDAWKDKDTRPWYTANEPEMSKVLSPVTVGIKQSYQDFFHALRDIGDIRTRWLPGNHDRLIAFTQEGEELLRDLALEYDGNFEVIESSYQSIARHGHLHDPWNYRDNSYEFCSFGDAVVVEILNKMQVEIMKARGCSGAAQERISFLAGIEYVPGHLRVPLWLHDQIERQQDSHLAALIADKFTGILESFLANWESPHHFGSLLSTEDSTMVAKFFKFLVEQFREKAPVKKFLRRLLNLGTVRKKIEKALESVEQEMGASHRLHLAAKRENLPEGVVNVIYGHSHSPQTDYRRCGGRFYLNSGWWKKSIRDVKGKWVPYTDEFTVIVLNDNGDPPMGRSISVDSPAEWDHPYEKPVLPPAALIESDGSRIETKQEVLIEMGVVNMLKSDPERYEFVEPKYPKVPGFEVIVVKESAPVTMVSGVMVKRHVRPEDISNVSQMTTASGIDNTWFFSQDRADPSVKRRAEESGNVILFDRDDISRLDSPDAFKALLEEKKGKKTD